jgi:hypothetical protein
MAPNRAIGIGLALEEILKPEIGGMGGHGGEGGKQQESERAQKVHGKILSVS